MSDIDATVEAIASAKTWDRRVDLIRKIPESYGTVLHRSIYAKVAADVYLGNIDPDFAYIHWREEYELPEVEKAYTAAHALTGGFTKVSVGDIAHAIEQGDLYTKLP